MVEIPAELRHLKDFPAYDASFQDGPNFRQNLSHWALRTDKVREQQPLKLPVTVCVCMCVRV